MSSCTKIRLLTCYRFHEAELLMPRKISDLMIFSYIKSYSNGTNKTPKIGFQDIVTTALFMKEYNHVSISSFCKLLLAGWVWIQNSDSHSFNKLSGCKHKNLNMTYCNFFYLHPLRKFTMNNIKVSIYWVNVKPKLDNMTYCNFLKLFIFVHFSSKLKKRVLLNWIF